MLCFIKLVISRRIEGTNIETKQINWPVKEKQQQVVRNFGQQQQAISLKRSVN